MKPTELPAAVRATDTRATLPIPAPPLETGAIVLRPEQVPQAQQALRTLDFGAVAPGDIINIGLGSDQAL